MLKLNLFSKRKRRKSIPVHAVCRNCGTPLISRYCHNCGQDLFAGARRSVKELISNAIGNIFCLDNKILVTLKYLLFFPGRLSVEFAKGRVISYVHPAKLFWFITILFFAVIASQIPGNWIEMETDLDEDNKKELNEAVTDAKKEVFDTKEVTGDENNEIFERKIEKLLKGDKAEVQEMTNNIKTLAPFTAFLLIPVFAFLLFVFFHKQKKMFVDHFVFALHIHSFMFLWYALILLASKIPNISHFYSSGWLTLFVPLLYVCVAVYVFYHPRIRSLIWRILLLNFFYFMSLVIISVFLLATFVGFMAKYWQ
jgi:hypothetical protein